jgi:hypothetical protein
MFITVSWEFPQGCGVGDTSVLATAPVYITHSQA